MRPRVPLVLALLISAGCLGASEDAADVSVTRARADVTRDLGGIEGTVADASIAPLVGARVTLLEINETVATRADGSFAFPHLRPGTYTLTTSAPGFVPAQQSVQVRAALVSMAEFVLAALATDLPFVQQFELTGFFEYGLAWAVNGSPVPPPHPFLDGFRVVTCSSEEGASCETELLLEPPMNTLVFEMVWDPAGSFAEKLFVTAGLNVTVEETDVDLFTAEGESPLQVRLDASIWEGLRGRIIAGCAEGDAGACGLDPAETGWPVGILVFPSWKCQTDVVGGCAALQQDFTQYVTAFYNAPAPEAYSVLDA